MHRRLTIVLALALTATGSLLHAQDAAAPSVSLISDIKAGSVFKARDTLDCGIDPMGDAVACLDELKWVPDAFSVRCEPAKPGYGDWLVRFPTPFASGDATNDSVAMEWYVAHDAEGRAVKAPAVVVVHESGRGMVAGRTFARGLRQRGLHTFLVHLPGYGERTSEFTRDMKRMLPALRQAVADVRRARDAVAALPHVDAAAIGLQGTSLGGFVAATVSGLDRGYHKSFILLAGGQLAEVLLTGGRDAASMRRRLSSVGVTDEQIRELTKVIEPMRLAHRVDPQRTWLFSGKFDEVVPPACSLAFAKAAKLDVEHHWILPVGHYTAALLLPVILPAVSDLMHGKPLNLAK